MKPVLVIGTTCADLILTVDHLPVTEEDINPSSQTLSIGGCAFNVANIIRQSGVPVTLASPVGSGIYGSFIAEKLTEKGFPIFVRLNEENGCCYCLVEKNGERTFLSYHGAEYTFDRKWMKSINIDSYGFVYVCGIEIEEPTGIEILKYLESISGPQICFCPGPRLSFINASVLQRILALHPMLHLNQKEALLLSGCSNIEEACSRLYKITHNSIIVTLGKAGAYSFENGKGAYIPGFEAKVSDTIGAGDSHIGQVLSCLCRSYSLNDAVLSANKVSSCVVSTKGACLTDEQYNSIFR